MSGSMPCEKISPTAKVVAFLRSFTDIPYTRALSDKSNAEEAAREIFKKHNIELDDFLWLVPVIEARHKSIENLLRVLYITLEQDYGDIVVDLASGFSPTGMIFSRDPNINYLEVDLPEIIEEKEVIVRSIVEAERPNLQFMAANVLDDRCFMNIENILGEGPVIVVCEGLLPYFNLEEKAMLANRIFSILDKKGGIFITPDISSKERLKAMLELEPKLVKAMEIFSGVTQRNLIDNSFESPDEAKSFFCEIGFNKIFELKLSELGLSLSSMPAISDTYQMKANAILKISKIWAMKLE